jgi:iron complex outermembrane receptor protein
VRLKKTIIWLLWVPLPLLAQQQQSVSEKDYFGELPIVMSATRLPQRLDETPAAMTVIDREMIRMSGARDVVDLMRLVPGFRLYTSFEGGNGPQASYHAKLGDFSNQMQVLVDGRSAYSPYLVGGIGSGLQTVAIDDIERIEVLRGSNSATYGARAFLGTINIVTRDLVETQGVSVSAARGDNAIQDTLARLGWGDERARFRLTVDRRLDRGLDGSSGPDQVDRFNLRGDFKLSAQDKLELRLGQHQMEAGLGFAGQEGNMPRTLSLTTGYAQLDWHRQLESGQELLLQVSKGVETLRDNFIHGWYPTIVLDRGGSSQSDNLLLQHTLNPVSGLRLAWGGELRSERLRSLPVFGSSEEQTTSFRRLFANAEWRLRKDLLLNFGGTFENSSTGGDHFSPRAVLNWHATQRQTLRLGYTSAHRPPSAFEKFGLYQVFDTSGVPRQILIQSPGNLSSERVNSREIGYLGEFPGQGLSVDVRVFEEELRNIIQLKPPTIVQTDSYNIHGWEYQLRWKPWQSTKLIYSQTLSDAGAGNSINSTSLMWMQHLPARLDFSLQYYQADPINSPGGIVAAPAMSRTDLRLAKKIRLDGHRAELSLVIQNLGPAYQDFRSDFHFRRQAYLMVRFEP